MIENVSQLRILVVEDEDSLRAGLEDFLRGLGMNVSSSRDGEEAQQTIAKERQSFQVILTDLFMPKTGGLQVLVAAKRRNPETQVVLMTGFGSLETAIEAMRQGAFDYITKPFQFVEIEMILDRIAERIRLMDENLILTERIQGLYTRLDLLKDNRTKFDRFITETTDKLEEQGRRIDDCLDMIKKVYTKMELSSSIPLGTR
jgi:two-component system response regulator AtoC